MFLSLIQQQDFKIAIFNPFENSVPSYTPTHQEKKWKSHKQKDFSRIGICMWNEL